MSSMQMLLDGIAAVVRAHLDAEVQLDDIEPPQKTEFGDLAVPCFPFSKVARKPPAAIAAELAPLLGSVEGVREAVAVGPFVNIHIEDGPRTVMVLERVHETLGKGRDLDGQTVFVEFSSPNANKPQHLGHVRNNLLGDSVCRLLAARGAKVVRTNLINDRGLPIFKSLWQWRETCPEMTPADAGVKGDLFVGNLYVAFANQEAIEKQQAQEKLRADGVGTEGLEFDRLVDAQCPSIVGARDLMRAWEGGDQEVRDQWEMMIGWVLEGFDATYQRMGIEFDRIDRESGLYLLGRTHVLRAVEDGLAVQDADDSVWMDLSNDGLDRKLLLRSDGTSVYITQDIGVAITRKKDLDFDRGIYIVGSEQDYHFQALFLVLHRLGQEWSDRLQHLSYGMIGLPDGRMKSREGRVVDADDLMDQVMQAVVANIQTRAQEDDGPAGQYARELAGDAERLQRTAEEVAQGALRFFVLKFNPRKDFVFDPEASIALTGDTGPYVQYTHARCCQLLHKALDAQRLPDPTMAALEHPLEREVLLVLLRYSKVVAKAAESANPAGICSYLLELCRSFNSFYAPQANLPILGAEPALSSARLGLVEGVREVLADGLGLLGMNAPNQM